MAFFLEELGERLRDQPRSKRLAPSQTLLEDEAHDEPFDRAVGDPEPIVMLSGFAVGAHLALADGGRCASSRPLAGASRERGISEREHAPL